MKKRRVKRHEVTQPDDPSIRLIPLDKGQTAIVSADDYPSLSRYGWYAKWNADTKSFYAARSSARINGKQHTIRMHREILGLKHGDKRHGDHENHNTLDNRRENIRIATGANNSHNQGVRSSNASGFKGVYWHNTCRKWVAQIGLNRKLIYLGLYPTPKDAARAYDEAALRLHGAFAKINGTAD